jgi:hypothetical protein
MWMEVYWLTSGMLKVKMKFNHGVARCFNGVSLFFSLCLTLCNSVSDSVLLRGKKRRYYLIKYLKPTEIPNALAETSSLPAITEFI